MVDADHREAATLATLTFGCALATWAGAVGWRLGLREAGRMEGRAAGKRRHGAQSGRSARNEVGRGVGLR